MKHKTAQSILALRRLAKKEQRLLLKKTAKDAPYLSRVLADKLPPKLRDTLHGAFLRAFEAIFRNGSAVIDKTIPSEKMQTEYALHRYTAALKPTKKHLRAFTVAAQKRSRGNTLLSGTAGAAMGFLGIGLPDIPVLVGFLLKTVYETALANGFDYKTPGEQYFILLLIESALTFGAAAEERETLVNAWIEAHRSIPAGEQRDTVFRNQLQRTADALADAVLYMKFIQGLPVIGVTGGISDAVCVSQVGTYAAMKYERRRLTQRRPQTTDEQ